MTIPPEYTELPNGTLHRNDGATVDYGLEYWGHAGRSSIEDQCWNVHGFRNEAGETKSEAVLKHCTGKRLLEIGCAPGAFMRLAKDRGFECTGIEPCEAHLEFIRQHSGCEVLHGTFEGVKLRGKFDSIAAMDLLEHLEDPVAFVAKAMRLLKPNGRLVLMLPLIMEDGLFDDGNFIPEHINLFSERHIREWLKPVSITRWVLGHEIVIVEKGGGA